MPLADFCFSALPLGFRRSQPRGASLAVLAIEKRTSGECQDDTGDHVDDGDYKYLVTDIGDMVVII